VQVNGADPDEHRVLPERRLELVLDAVQDVGLVAGRQALWRRVEERHEDGHVHVEQQVIDALERAVRGHEDGQAVALALQDGPAVPGRARRKVIHARLQLAVRDGLGEGLDRLVDASDPSFDVVLPEEVVEADEQDPAAQRLVLDRRERRAVPANVDALARVALVDREHEVCQGELRAADLERERLRRRGLAGGVVLPGRVGRRAAVHPALRRDAEHGVPLGAQAQVVRAFSARAELPVERGGGWPRRARSSPG
jgi:hypothetical protein